MFYSLLPFCCQLCICGLLHPEYYVMVNPLDMLVLFDCLEHSRWGFHEKYGNNGHFAHVFSGGEKNNLGFLVVMVCKG